MHCRVLQERKDDPREQIRRAIRRAYGRVATKQETESLTRYLAEMNEYHAQHLPTPIEYPKYVTRSLVEEFTGEPFTFQEWLNVYEDYVPDKKPWTVSAEVRALADVCLLLMNPNEFVYVY